jgi:hypothetical protein
MRKMPKPKGWTDAMLRKRDRIVKGMMKKGIKEPRAYALATALVKKHARRQKK